MIKTTENAYIYQLTCVGEAVHQCVCVYIKSKKFIISIIRYFYAATVFILLALLCDAQQTRYCIQFGYLYIIQFKEWIPILPTTSKI